MRCIAYNYVGHPVLFSYNIGIGAVDYGKFVDLQTDVNLAFKLANTGSIEPAYGKYCYATLTDVHERALQLLETEVRLDMAFDTETLGLDRFDPNGYIISLQFSFEPGTAFVVALYNKESSNAYLLSVDNQKILSFLLNSPKIRTCAANGKYDIEWVYEKTGIDCTNFNFDTTMVGSLLDENRSNGIDVHAKIYAPALAGYSDEFDAKADKSRMDLEYTKSPSSFLKYSGGDADATLQVKHAQKEELIQDPALTGFYVNIMHPALRAFSQVERTGVVLDMDAYQELESDLNTEIASLIKASHEILGGILVAKHWDKKKPHGLNLTKASLIADFMFSPKGLNLKPKMVTETTKAPSSSMEHLEMFQDVAEAKEFVGLMQRYTSATKTLNTYITGFQKHIRADGRYHPTYYLFAGNKEEGEGGTNTGRISVKDPAWQTVPKHTKWAKAIRRCYPAPPGHLVLEIDYQQGELKVIACIANEQNMIEAYANGLDLHVVTSGGVAGLSYEQMMALKKSDKDKYDAIRQLGKAGNFGLIFGMGIPGFQAYARSNYGVSLSIAEATAFHEGFFSKYPQLPVYHSNYKAYAKKHGYVRNPLGRVRHLPLVKSPYQDVASKAERNAINAPVQSTLTDMMVWAISIEHGMGWLKEAPCFGAVHDASYHYVPEDKADFHAKRIMEVMENLPFETVGWSPQLKFTTDAKIGQHMGALKEIHF